MLLLLAATVQHIADPQELPPVAREFRAAWIATVDHIDWPSRGNVDPARQRLEMTRLLDMAVKLKLNTVLFQVRPAADALYDSKIEPWSEYLTGKQGVAPLPYYDPLAFAVEEAHKRGLQIQAWINPYRAKHPSATGPLAAGHVAMRNPEVVRTYSNMLWMDPGLPFVRKRTVQVVEDIVSRYDIDGVHLDDYFYPYREGGKDFPDDATFSRYGRGESKDAWRRHNVDLLIQEIDAGIHRIKPYVEFGVSPFGIYRPNMPEGIKAGVDQYADLGSDPVGWLRNGWCDYLSPQLYWPIGQKAQSFTTLLAWWQTQNVHGRHLWPGLYTSRLLSSHSTYTAAEISNQIQEVRKILPGDPGHIHFSMKALTTDAGGVDEVLENSCYSQAALPPESPWLKQMECDTPIVRPQTDGTLSWVAAGNNPPFWYVVYLRYGSRWKSTIVPGALSESMPMNFGSGTYPNEMAISAVSRTGEMSPAARITLAPSAEQNTRSSVGR